MPAAPALAVPDFARRLGAILCALAALIARRFLANPLRASLIVPLWRYLTRAGRRLAATFARAAAATPAKPRRPHPGGLHCKPTLPSGHAWLVAALGAEAAACASQLESLLAEPEAALLLANSPAAQRALAPIRRLLGTLPPRPRRPRVRKPRQPSPPPPAAAPRPTPPLWLRERPPEHTRTRWLLPPRRSG